MNSPTWRVGFSIGSELVKGGKVQDKDSKTQDSSDAQTPIPSDAGSSGLCRAPIKPTSLLLS